MPTPVYTLVINALSSSVSERAADTMLKAALKDAQFSPDSVTAQEMQTVLSGPLLRRLASVLPQAQASRDLRALSRRIAEQHPRALTLFVDPEGPLHWDSLDDDGQDEVGGLQATISSTTTRTSASSRASSACTTWGARKGRSRCCRTWRGSRACRAS